MSRFEPKNREEAFTYQFEDDVKMLRAIAFEGEKKFEHALSTLEGHILAYRSARLKTACKKTKKKNEEREKYMKKHYPHLYK